MEATVYDAGFFLERLTNAISLIPVAEAWLSYEEAHKTLEDYVYVSWENVT